MSWRPSYWKTTLISLVVAGASAVIAWRASSFESGLLAAILSLPLAVLAAFSGAVALGGFVCLWRDTREAAGKRDLFEPSANKAHPAGWLSRCGLRFLLGPQLRTGDFVRVKSLDEIHATLDEGRRLEELAFMPEMEAVCGNIFRVHRRLEKINDMRNKTGLRRMRNAVTLTNVRCSGSAHGGCQAECQIVWKDAWLRRIPTPPADALPLPSAVAHTPVEELPEPTPSTDPVADDQTYGCQMTEFWNSSEEMSRWDIRQDLRPLLTGNIGLGAYLLALFTRLFNRVQLARGGVMYPAFPPCATTGRTPAADVHFQENDRVVIRNKAEISKTLVKSRNKGLWFDRELVRFCGQPAVVRRRITRVIDERTAKMVEMKTPAVILENVVATGEYLRLCPQHEFIFWREIWLRPAEPEDRAASSHEDLT